MLARGILPVSIDFEAARTWAGATSLPAMKGP